MTVSGPDHCLVQSGSTYKVSIVTSSIPPGSDGCCPEQIVSNTALARVRNHTFSMGRESVGGMTYLH